MILDSAAGISDHINAPSVIVYRDEDLLAKATAARLITRLTDIQAARSSASLVLTGGGIGIATLTELNRSPARDAVNWQRLDLWWGDERFLPSGDPDRNETQARTALLDTVDLDPTRVHAMPTADGPDGPDPQAAAAWYAAKLRAAAELGEGALQPIGLSEGALHLVPSFDVLLLGMGPDGHVASLFPGTPALNDSRPVVAVQNAPKPPLTRLSLTLSVIQAAREVWILVAGKEKARAVLLALSGTAVTQIPAVSAAGREHTRWLLDRPAASQLPGTPP